MSAPYSTLLLDLTNWDLVLDSNGNIAVAAPPYALAQDVASACKTFLGELWFDESSGVNYQGQILGRKPPLSLLQQYLVTAALTVPGVVTATCIINAYDPTSGVVNGQVVFIDVNGDQRTVNL